MSHPELRIARHYEELAPEEATEVVNAVVELLVCIIGSPRCDDPGAGCGDVWSTSEAKDREAVLAAILAEFAKKAPDKAGAEIP